MLFDIVIYVVSRLVEGARKAEGPPGHLAGRAAFIIALLPLISLRCTVIVNGLARFDIPFFTESMRNVIGEGGGALHAIVGTLLITGMAALISVPIGLLTADLPRRVRARHASPAAITFFVDVMTGIPSIVAGLFAYALFALCSSEPGIRFGFVAPSPCRC